MSSNDKSTSTSLIVIILSILFVIPIALWFSMLYNVNGGTINTFLLFLGIFVIAVIITLVYYRMTITKIDGENSEKMTKSKVQYIITSTLGGFMILILTLGILGINPELIEIFANTIGIWFIGIIGNSNFCNEIFRSDIFSELSEYNKDSRVFNQNFILTRFNNDNIDDFVQYFKGNCKKEDSGYNIDFPFDFKPNFENEGQVTKLRQLVSLKHLIGYFTWVYIASVISLVVTIIAVSIKRR